MKIKNIDIKSFGVIKNWKADINDNLVVVYGANETGKSTITEFIRSTLFPILHKRNQYPLRDPTDSGSITVEMNSGDTKVLLRKGKKVTEDSGKKTVADEFPGMNAETYRSIYGLDLDGLSDMDAISSNDVSRLLTISGGEKIPEVSKSIEKKMDLLMNKKSAYSGIIGRTTKEIEIADTEIANIHSNMNQYSQLVSEREELKNKISDVNADRQKIMDDRAKKEVLRSQIANLEKLKVLEQDQSDCEKYIGVPTESYSHYKRLKDNIDDLSSKIEYESKTDHTLILEHKDDIINVWEYVNQYLDDIESIKECDSKIQNYHNETAQMEKDIGWTPSAIKNVKTGQDVIERSMAEVKSKKSMPIGLLLTIMGLALAAISLFLIKNKLCMAASFATISAGITCVLFSIKRSRQWKKWIIMQGYPPDTTPNMLCSVYHELKKLVDLSTDMDNITEEKKKYKRGVDEYISKVSSLSSTCGYAMNDIIKSINSLHDALKEADNNRINRSTHEQQLNEEKDKLAEFLREYGDEESFLTAYEKKKKYDELDSKIKTLRQSIEASTSMKISDLDVLINNDDTLPQPEDFDTGYMERRIGEINKEMSYIMDEEELDKQLQKKMKSENDLKRALREWAKLSIANSIITGACDSFYDNLQPDVVKDTNKYLSLMTDGRYKLDNDPRNDKLIIRDKNTKKNDKEWSSGLNDQVYLSLKMAMAKWFLSEELPLILDDVLVRFDNDRKMGACRAIYEFSKESQVIIFTCDDNLRNSFNNCGEHTEILLPDKSNFGEVAVH